ncbi:MAG: hypothetical protein RLT87_01850 [Gammaproteobacteria bacterium]
MKQNWFYRKSSIRKLWIGSWVLLALSLIAEFFVKLHPHFKLEEIIAFHAWFGFLACVGMVIVARLLGFLIRRKDDYYDM